MRKYFLHKEFTEDPRDANNISVSPHWVVAVFSFAQPLSFSRAKMKAILDNYSPGTGMPSASFDNDNTQLVKVKPPLIIHEDCLRLTVSQSKNSHIGQMDAVISASSVNYLSEVQPGDWVMAWIQNYPDGIEDLKQRIREGQPCNKWSDGLKFVGRIESVRKTITQSGDGKRTASFAIRGMSFKELDTPLYYNPHSQLIDASLNQFFARIGVKVDELLQTSSERAANGQGGIDPSRAISTMFELLMGKGISKENNNPAEALGTGSLTRFINLTASDDVPYAYVIPEVIAKILGRDTGNTSAGMTSYAAIVNMIIGRQRYTAEANNNPSPSNYSALFQPDFAGASTISILQETPLQGTFMPLSVSFNEKSVWSILSMFINGAINEIYACLRASPSDGGSVVPTIIARQIPLSTNALDPDRDQTTPFLELPRWVVTPSLVANMDIGKTDAGRFNFIQVYGVAPSTSAQIETFQDVRSPAIRDDQDIKRNGIKPYIKKTECSIQDTYFGPSKWKKLVSDFVIGQQFCFNGIISLVGIQAPICVGDNLEFDGTVFHIESISHQCQVMQGGEKAFTTNLAISYGIRSESAEVNAELFTFENEIRPATENSQPIRTQLKSIGAGPQVGQNAEILIYTGVAPSDHLGYNPGLSEEPTKKDDDNDGSGGGNDNG